jgi:hypothetical protein
LKGHDVSSSVTELSFGPVNAAMVANPPSSRVGFGLKGYSFNTETHRSYYQVVSVFHIAVFDEDAETVEPIGGDVSVKHRLVVTG